MMLDFWAIFPYHLEDIGVQSLVSQLAIATTISNLFAPEVGNSMMVTLTNVLSKSWEYLKLLIFFIMFGGVLFWSIVYWVELEKWKYYEPTDSYQFVRLGVDGVTEEISRKYRKYPLWYWHIEILFPSIILPSMLLI